MDADDKKIRQNIIELLSSGLQKKPQPIKIGESEKLYWIHLTRRGGGVMTNSSEL